MSKLDTLRENRSKINDQVEAKKAELAKTLEERAWTAEEEAELESLVGRRSNFDKLIEEAETEEREAKAQQEERDRKLGGNTPENTPDVRVGAENDLVYSMAHPENSYYRDLLAANWPTHPRHEEALATLRRHREQVDGILRHGGASQEVRALRKYAQEARRGTESESRSVSTGTSSMGDFAPPVYFLSEYAPYRTYGRSLIEQLRSHPMPESGLVFNVPLITQPTQGTNQTNSSTQGNNENQTVTSRDMTSTYQSGTVQTIIDNLNVSQQYLDRVGPGIDGDMIVRDDQNRQVNRTLNIYAWNQLFGTSGIGTNAYTDSAFNAQKFKAVVHGAKAAIRKTDGVVAYPTHFFGDADLWESIEGAYDSSGRPYVVPQGVAFNPIAVGDESNAPEGYTGFKFAGVPAFADEAMWVSWSGGAASSGFSGDHPALIGDLSIAAYWLEGTPVVRVLPQPGASTLTVLIQQYVYCAYVPIYAAALQLVFGTGTATANLL